MALTRKLSPSALLFSCFLGFGLTILFITGCAGDSAAPAPPEEVLSSEGVLATTGSGYENDAILMQGFYWDSFNESGEGDWWDLVSSRVPELAEAGVTAIWLPPSQKSAHSPSMGYDPYDFFDQGSYPQKGRTETYFGSRQELQNLIANAHQHGMDVYADLVYNHMSGGAAESNPITGETSYTNFVPLSGEYQFDYNNFHPSQYSVEDEGSFGGFPDLDHDNPDTYAMVAKHILWLKNEIGYDGWRFDYVKGYAPSLVSALQDTAGGFAIGEFYDGDVNKVLDWLAAAGDSLHAFDFPLFFRLQQMCNTTGGGFDMEQLWQGGLLFRRPGQSVSFAENHDTDKDNPIITDKMMAYAYIMTHEGIPTIFWRDYYNYSLARVGEPNGIYRLMWVRKTLARGSTDLLFSNDDVYVVQRDGDPGLLLGLNDDPQVSKRVRITTAWPDQSLQLVAHRGSGSPEGEITSDADGVVTITIPPRGYVIYGPGNYTL